MRILGRCAILVVLAGSVLYAVQAPPVDPAAVLTAARDAMGGEKRLSAVKTFVASGRTQQVRGDNLVPIEFEISCELPDKYIRRDEIPAQGSGPTTIGFNGDALIQLPVPGPPPARAGVPPPTEAQLDAQRLALGMFASSFNGYPLTFTYVGQAEAPQGKADVLEAKGAANFTARLFVYRETHLPIMVSWQTTVENRLYYADYRDVDGVKFPFRLRRAVGADTVEETTFDKFKINAKIDPKKFEASK
jgi:hypothetical protein